MNAQKLNYLLNRAQQLENALDEDDPRLFEVQVLGFLLECEMERAHKEQKDYYYNEQKDYYYKHFYNDQYVNKVYAYAKPHDPIIQ